MIDIKRFFETTGVRVDESVESFLYIRYPGNWAGCCDGMGIKATFQAITG